MSGTNCSRRQWLLGALCGAATPLAAPWAQAAEVGAGWPDGPVKIVVPYGAGGGADFFGRIVADAFGQQAGRTAVVLNQPGAAGTIGSRAVAQSAPNGQMWLISGIGSHVIAPQWQEAGFDTFKDFRHLAILGGHPSVLLAQSRLGVRRLTDLRGQLSWASPGAGSHGHLLGTVIMQRLGLGQSVHIPYKGGAFAMQDLLGGHVDLAVVTLTSALPHLSSPDVVPLAITSANRSPIAPQIPTFAELGLKDLTASTWFGLAAPAGLDRGVETLAMDAIRRAYASEPVLLKLREHGVVSGELDSQRTSAFLQAEWRRWGQ